MSEKVRKAFFVDKNNKKIYILDKHELTKTEEIKVKNLTGNDNYEIVWMEKSIEVTEKKDKYYKKEYIKEFLNTKGKDCYKTFLEEEQKDAVDKNGITKFYKNGKARKRGFVGALKWFKKNYEDEYKIFMENKKK